jgi:hypothetical protein
MICGQESCHLIRAYQEPAMLGSCGKKDGKSSWELQPTRLSRLDFETGFVVVGGSDQSGALQSRLAAELHFSTRLSPIART